MWSQVIEELYKHSSFTFLEHIIRKLIIQVPWPASPATHPVLPLLFSITSIFFILCK